VQSSLVPIIPPPFFQDADIARAAADRAELPHLGNHTRAIGFGCLKDGVRILTSEYTMTVKMMIALAGVATSRNNDACIR
jgi:hypothetical protein